MCYIVLCVYYYSCLCLCDTFQTECNKLQLWIKKVKVSQGNVTRREILQLCKYLRKTLEILTLGTILSVEITSHEVLITCVFHSWE